MSDESQAKSALNFKDFVQNGFGKFCTTHSSGQVTTGLSGISLPEEATEWKCGSEEPTKRKSGPEEPTKWKSGDWAAVAHKWSDERWVIAPANVRTRSKSEWPCLAIDQVVRLGLGIEIEANAAHSALPTVHVRKVDEFRKSSWNGEPKAVSRLFNNPTARWRQRLAVWLLPTVNVMCNVTRGELTLAEQNAVVLEELTLDALGIKSGDEVVLTSIMAVRAPAEPTSESDADTWKVVRASLMGVTEPPQQKHTWKVVRTQKKVKAYAENEVIRDRRGKNLVSDESGTLPRIWVGEAIRTQLNVKSKSDSKTIGEPVSQVLLVSPSRMFVLVDHFREAAVALAFGGVAAVIVTDQRIWAVPCFVAAIGLLVARVRIKLR